MRRRGRSSPPSIWASRLMPCGGWWMRPGAAGGKAKIGVPDMGGLDDLLKRAGECRDAVTALFSLGTEAHRAAERVGDAALELRSAQRRLRGETKGRCPLCGGPLDG